jgi:hypothetical protein
MTDHARRFLLLAMTCSKRLDEKILNNKRKIMDSNEATSNPDQEHHERVSGAFSALEQDLGVRAAEEAKRLQDLREATLKRDRASVEKHLSLAKRESNWLYEELMKHPMISSIMRELSIMGF